MLDVLYLAITVAFFAIAVAFGAVKSSMAGPSMSDYIWTSIVTLLLLIYLLYALIKPEKF